MSRDPLTLSGSEILARAALMRIANGYTWSDGGQRSKRRLMRHEQTQIAREACERLGLDFTGAGSAMTDSEEVSDA
jgi:hypothetical protein